MIDRFTMANLVLSVYCHNKRMICKNIFTGVHDWESVNSNLFHEMTYFAMCFNKWECLALVHWNPECRREKASVSAPNGNTTSFT